MKSQILQAIFVILYPYKCVAKAVNIVISELCDLDCGPHGHCVGDSCVCNAGWSGEFCTLKQCDPRYQLLSLVTRILTLYLSVISNLGINLYVVCSLRKSSTSYHLNRCKPQDKSEFVALLLMHSLPWTKDRLIKSHTLVIFVLHISVIVSYRVTWNYRCNEHGQCKNGTCLCVTGWNGRHCTMEGCPNSCSGHGQCRVSSDGAWECRCYDGWDGRDCSVALEQSCNDGKDNDKGGLVFRLTAAHMVTFSSCLFILLTNCFTYSDKLL